MANGQPIDEYRVQPGPISIGYSLAFEERQARIEEGMTPEAYDALPGTPQWIIPGGPEWTKCHVIMGYRMAQRIPELQTMRRLSLPSPPPKSDLPPLRKQRLETGMSTLEAVAQALALLEGEEVAKPLLELHRVHVERSLALRYPVSKERREQVYPSLKPRS